ncbi:hypothetical protein BT69DRAFT_444843 [Atractiella rhizophila]|nr:hypothetical protein BT69DRAFT_444843 [Atractiella rhizophila]
MWNRRNWIAYFFGVFAIAGTAVQVWSVAQNEALHLLPGLRGCISVGRVQNRQWVYWVPLLLYDTTATMFTLVPIITHWNNTPPTRLLSIFIRDGVLYFIIVFICNLVNVIYFSVPRVLISSLNAPLAIAFTTMMASRIVLHLRSAACRLNSGDGGSASGSYGGNNTVPKFRSPRKWDVGEQIGGRQMEDGLYNPSLDLALIQMGSEPKRGQVD